MVLVVELKTNKLARKGSQESYIGSDFMSDYASKKSNY